MALEVLRLLYEQLAATPNLPHELINYIFDALIAHYPAHTEVPHV